MMTDPVADLLIRIKNAGQRGHETVTIPASKLKAAILRVLKAEGFIRSFETENADGHSRFCVQLRYIGEGQPVIAGMRRISKPGQRVYVGKRDMPRVMAGLGVAILSTSRGVMTDQESRRAGLGGEVLCEVW